MAVTVDPSGGPGPGTSANGADRLGPLDAAGVCPYLISADGAWRSLRPHRDHRCGALSPATVVAPEKQRALCLVDAHGSCATYKAARARARGTRPSERVSQPLWPVARTAPVIIEPARARLQGLPGLPGRTTGQALLGALMVVAFVAVVVARTSSPGPASTVPPASDPVASVLVTPRPTPRPSPSPSPSASPTAAPTPIASQATYKVKSGDTLQKIASHYGVKVAAVMAANGITDGKRIRVGQSLIIPAKAPKSPTPKP
jgi:LysM repeat protein